MLFTMLICSVVFLLFVGIIKFVALMFTIPFTMFGYLFKGIFGIMLGILLIVTLVGVIGGIGLFVILPIGLIVYCWNRRSY